MAANQPTSVTLPRRGPHRMKFAIACLACLGAGSAATWAIKSTPSAQPSSTSPVVQQATPPAPVSLHTEANPAPSTSTTTPAPRVLARVDPASTLGPPLPAGFPAESAPKPAAPVQLVETPPQPKSEAPTPPKTTKPTPTPVAVTPTAKLLNVNRASQAELELLPGIGPALAKRIIDHREKNGAFKSVEDLDKVKGIGPAMIKKLAPLVRFDEPPPAR